MQQVWKFSFAVALSALLVACGSTAAKDKKGEITDIKSKLEKLKKDKTGLDTEIRQLEEQLAKADPDAASVKKLIAVDTLRIQDFAHYIDLRGKNIKQWYWLCGTQRWRRSDQGYLCESRRQGFFRSVSGKTG